MILYRIILYIYIKMLCTEHNNFQEKWDYFALHIWLIFSSYGIMFALLSFIDDIRGMDNPDRPWIKGLIAILLGTV